MNCVLPALFLALASAPPVLSAANEAVLATQSAAPSNEQQIDSLFAKWDKPNTPGAAVLVIQDGKVVLRKGYGMANIEHNVPITPATVFNIASTSKQFTAAAIHLLAQEGKLSLDDDVRQHLPELAHLGNKITLRQLLQHTSGMRDYHNLLIASGWRTDDVITDEDAFDMIKRQRTLNFAPGQEYLYSNTGYFLAAQVVQRVSGKTLPEFTRERVFSPLGMAHTTFQDNYRSLLPGRAQQYVAAPSGRYHYVAHSTSNAGPGNLLTTVEDLALWDQNFYDAKVGGQELVQSMQIPGILNDGKAIQYASGLFINSYRGQKTVEHAGGLAGFRAQMVRFPDLHFTTIVLTNTSEISPVGMARRIADIFLADKLAPRPAAKANTEAAFNEAEAYPTKLGAYVGFYGFAPDFGLKFMLEDGKLVTAATGQQKITLSAGREHEFFNKEFGIRLVFAPPGKDGLSASVMHTQEGEQNVAKRAKDPGLPGHGFKDYVGDYYSEELRAIYSTTLKDGKLTLQHPRGNVDLTFVGGGKFASGYPIGDITFQCTGKKGCSGLTVNSERIRDLRFTRIFLRQ